jgi:hypothetical protein
MKNNLRIERSFGDCLENNISGNEISYRLKPLICGTTVISEDAPSTLEPEEIFYEGAPDRGVFTRSLRAPLRQIERPFDECIENSVGGNEILYKLAPLGCITCFKLDPLPDTPSFGSLKNPYSVSGSIQYGLMPAEDVAEDKTPYVGELDNWDICPTYDFCSGPDQEGVTQAEPYSKRWFVKPEGADFVYGIDGETSALVPSDLFVGIDFDKITFMSISFDGNARPCFAFQIASGTILLRRYVAGTPTFTTFSGNWPKLFFNGVLQPDNTLTDLVCFYVVAGEVKTRFQRDNFGTVYTWLIATPKPVLKITKTDGYSSRQNLYFLDTVGKFWLARSAVYPLFPVVETDVSSVSLKPGSGVYFYIVAPGGSYDDTGLIALLPGLGSYILIVVAGGSYDDESSVSLSPGTGVYTLIVVLGGSYAESSSVGAKPGGGEYAQIAVPGGTYSETVTLGLKPGGGIYS